MNYLKQVIIGYLPEGEPGLKKDSMKKRSEHKSSVHAKE
jgi:hypothetical protein